MSKNLLTIISNALAVIAIALFMLAAPICLIGAEFALESVVNVGCWFGFVSPAFAILAACAGVETL